MSKTKLRPIKEVDIKVVPRGGRKLVGISRTHFERLGRLKKTTLGELSLAAVTAEVIELGLEALEAKKHG
jgi:hypothetical protein